MAAGPQTSASTKSKPSRAATAQAAAPDAKTSHAAFREFLRARQASKPGAKPVNAAPAFRPVLPTGERLKKADHPLRTAGGFYRVPAPIERMRNQGLLDKSPRINEALYTAAVDLAKCFYNSGLSEHIKSQDLTGAGGGATTASSYMPVNEFAAHNRTKFQAACKVMGWYEAYPLRGTGRLVVDVICHERSLKDAAVRHFPGTRTESALAAANDRLKEGLFLLANHWRLI